MRTFIKARMSLSEASRGKNKGQGWQVVKVSSKSEIGKGEDAAGEAEADVDAEASGFFTARTSPSGLSSKLALSREVSGASEPSRLVQPQTSKEATTSVAALQNFQAGIMYSQPVHDLPPPRLARAGGSSRPGWRHSSRLAVEMSEEHDVRVTLRFISTPTPDSDLLRQIFGASDDEDDAEAVTATPRWGEGRTITPEPFQHVVVNDGRVEGTSRGEGARRPVQSLMTAANDARVGVRGWKGPGSVFEEE
ncbi:hypothetical protein NMY22_g19054 [Coprinellus aureogranulatus]|nr:hypothetical protein NMY22_g19054 [Coprinellus aureogranulatus]